MAAPTYVQEAETVWNTSTTPKATANFTTSTGDVVVALAVKESEADGLLSATGTNVTLTSLQEVNVSSYTAVEASAGVVASGGTTSVSFAKASNVALQFHGGNALTFSATDGVGTSGSANDSTNTASVTITTTQANSAVAVAIGDWLASDGTSRAWATVNGYTPTAGNGYELTYFRDSSRYTLAIAYWPDVGAAGSKTFTFQTLTGGTPRSMSWSIVAVEIKGTGGGGAADAPLVPAGDAPILAVWNQLGIF